MTDKNDHNLDEHEIEVALAEELDEVAPRRDLWPSIRAGVRRPGPKSRRRWLVPAFASAAVSLLIVGLVLAQTWRSNTPSPGPIAAARPATPEFNPTAAGEAAPAPTTTTDAPEPTQALAASTGPAGDAGNGESVFTANGCSACHSTGSNRVIGPGLAGVVARAESRGTGQTAEEYIFTSITDPSAFIVAGFPNAMPGSFGSTISEGDIQDLIAYLATLN